MWDLIFKMKRYPCPVIDGQIMKSLIASFLIFFGLLQDFKNVRSVYHTSIMHTLHFHDIIPDV